MPLLSWERGWHISQMHWLETLFGIQAYQHGGIRCDHTHTQRIECGPVAFQSTLARYPVKDIFGK
jgi:hypothetical protein